MEIDTKKQNEIYGVILFGAVVALMPIVLTLKGILPVFLCVVICAWITINVGLSIIAIKRRESE